MKAKTSFTILLFLLVLFAFSTICTAQQTNQSTNQSSEITKETDHLPFMKTEQAAASQEPGTGGLLFKTFGAMLLIVGLIFFGAWGLKKTGLSALKSKDGKDAPDLAILSSVSVGSGRTISTVRFGGRVLLVGSTAQAFTLLADDTNVVDEPENLSFNPDSAVPRSVADLLNEEENSFELELQKAENSLGFLGSFGGRG